MKTVIFDGNGRHSPAYSCNKPGDKSGEYVNTNYIPVRAILLAKEELEKQVEYLIELGEIWSLDRAMRFKRNVEEIDNWLKDKD